MQHKFFQNSLQTFPADVSLEETLFFPTVLEKTKKKLHDNEKVDGSTEGTSTHTQATKISDSFTETKYVVQ